MSTQHDWNESFRKSESQNWAKKEDRPPLRDLLKKMHQQNPATFAQANQIFKHVATIHKKPSPQDILATRALISKRYIPLDGIAWKYDGAEGHDPPMGFDKIMNARANTPPWADNLETVPPDILQDFADNSDKYGILYGQNVGKELTSLKNSEWMEPGKLKDSNLSSTSKYKVMRLIAAACLANANKVQVDFLSALGDENATLALRLKTEVTETSTKLLNVVKHNNTYVIGQDGNAQHIIVTVGQCITLLDNMLPGHSTMKKLSNIANYKYWAAHAEPYEWHSEYETLRSSILYEESTDDKTYEDIKSCYDIARLLKKVLKIHKLTQSNASGNVVINNIREKSEELLADGRHPTEDEVQQLKDDYNSTAIASLSGMGIDEDNQVDKAVDATVIPDDKHCPGLDNLIQIRNAVQQYARDIENLKDDNVKLKIDVAAKEKCKECLTQMDKVINEIVGILP